MKSPDYYSRTGGLPGLQGLSGAADSISVKPMGYLGQDSAGRPVWSYAIRVASLASMGLLGYHGYMRNDSVGWALVWGVFGSIVWPITVPIALVQGLGKPKKITRNRRRRTSRRS